MSSFYTHVAYRNNKILIRGYDGEKRFQEKRSFKPWLFLPSKKKTDYTDIHGNYVERMEFSSGSEMRGFMNQYKDIDGFKFYGLDKPAYLYVYQKYLNCDFDTNKLKINHIDIEVSMEGGYPNLETADKEVTAITMEYPNQNRTFVLGCYDFKNDDPNTIYIKCKDEEDLLRKFLVIWSSDKFSPDIVTGWNIKLFDIPYLVRRIARILGDFEMKKMSPWGIVDQTQVMWHGKKNDAFIPLGIEILDYYDLYIKFVAVTKPLENYKLDTVAQEELGERKLDYSEYGNLQALYENDFQKFMEYNIRDTNLIVRLDKKLKLIDLVCFIAYGSGVNYSDALGTVKSWDVAIHNYLLDRNIVVDQSKYKDSGRQPQGAFVKPPIAGMHDWVMSFDLTSLYPHIIMGWNIGPDTFVGMMQNDYSPEQIISGEFDKYKDFLRENDFAVAGNMAQFKRAEESFLSTLMRDLFNKRKEYKNKKLELEAEKAKSSDPKSFDDQIQYYDTIQNALKIRLNSAYGALANSHYRYYDVVLAEAITRSGQLVIKWAAHHLNEYMNNILKTDDVDYVITVDTDSVYLNLGDFVKKTGLEDKKKIEEFLDRFGNEKVQPFLNKIFKKLADTMNCREQAMHMKREGISDRGVFIAKKRYMLNVLNNEGVHYKEPKLKIMGIESVRSSTPSICRTKLEEAFKIILQEDEETLQQFINDFKKEYHKASFDEIAFNSSTKGLSKYSDSKTIYGLSTPIYYRGALLYNHHRKVNGLENECEEIYEGDKVKYVYLKLPNPIQENVIASPTSKIPPGFGLEEYIDYETQFNKSYLEPLKRILDVIDWSDEKKTTLGGFWE